MRRLVISPLVRLSFSLTMLTVSILLVTDLLGLVPDTRKAELESRKVITESLAIQVSSGFDERRLESVENILRLVVERSEKMTSAAVRNAEGNLLAEFGGHSQYWDLQAGERSTATQVQVAVFNDDGRWGNVEVTFKPLLGGTFASFNGSFTLLVIFIGGVGFLAYLLFLKRAMHELNPDEVIPDRVRQALDTLSEGLLIIDNEGFIVFSNAEFARVVGMEPGDLVGKDSATLNWEIYGEEHDSSKFTLPWFSVLEGLGAVHDINIRLKKGLERGYTFSVNASPINANKGEVRGALITFNDITEAEQKNAELHRAMDKLESSKKEITRQNKELRVLATHDPLTGVLNRRSLFQGFEALLAEANQDDEELSCIMVDIDHFKLVNDNFGHTVGDEVIKLLARVLSEHSRAHDLVGRYGGEEFCIVLPEADVKIGITIAERIRLAIEESRDENIPGNLRITASFGVASLAGGAETPQELVEKADNALYVAKNNGRNRVVPWTPESNDSDAELGDILDSQVQQAVTEVLTAESEIIVTSDIAGEEIPAHASKEVRQDVRPVANDIGGLPTNALFLDCIDQGISRARRDNSRVAMMVIDLDTLQRVYDTLGLAVGDKLVKFVLTRLKQTLRHACVELTTDQDEMSFVLQHLESNKVAVVLTDVKQLDVVTNVLQRILVAFMEPFEVEGGEYYLNLNTGISVFPSDGEDPETLLKNASNAMREARLNQGGSNFSFYSNENTERAKKQIEMEAELHQALERGELVMYYQPKVDLRSGNINSMEALIRWQHPQLGLVPPDEFIELAERTGLINRISNWVFRTVCRQILNWQKEGHGLVTVAVNLSPVEFRDPNLGEQIIALVADYGVPASTIEIEITETAVIQSIDAAIAILEILSMAGFKLSLDDFGTGYSSLSYLKRFPLSKVKIDRSFITGVTQRPNDEAIVSAIIAMGHSLGLQVVAEGVETEEELRFLQGLLCDEIQGYLISKPVLSNEVIAMREQAAGIRRMVMEYSLSHREQAGLSKTAISDMIGILNECPVDDPVR
ncbi:EAL domain-containing protein [Aliamphritea ceti]|uniref:EAL domain-containing protein n=1 Tax=Aliamphritea ceti TaxID=1524258 RepID=UPI0021C317AD|nr:EAL domain-containing protein [Aliamphritea ceti]